MCPFHHKFENTFLFGAFSPITGSHLLLELPHCNTDTFQIFLNKFSALDKQEFKLLLLDNGAFHKAGRLVIPHNIYLLFLPPYSPELNPAEKIWAVIKKHLTNKAFKTMAELQLEINYIIKTKINLSTVKSITAFPFYLNAYNSILKI